MATLATSTSVKTFHHLHIERSVLVGLTGVELEEAMKIRTKVEKVESQFYLPS